MSKYIQNLWAQTKDQLMIRLLSDANFQPDDEDRRIWDLGNSEIDLVYEYKSCHLVSVGRFQSGKIKFGYHIYCRRNHEFSSCAENRPIGYLQMNIRKGHPDPLLTVATFHASHDKYGHRTGSPYLISPCPRCIRLFEELSPDALILTDLDKQGRLGKIPLEAVPFFAHPSRHNGEG